MTGQEFESFPSEINQKNLEEITAQPLLNYLFALGYCKGDLNFENTNDNLNVIYENLIYQVYERTWEQYGHPTLKSTNRNDFVRILEEIGVVCWHSNGLTATKSEIEKRCNKNNLKRMLDIFQEGAKEGVTRLLTAFYFRQSGEIRDSEHTFEFTHKSFGEYLISKRIVRELELIQRQSELHLEDSDVGWDERTCLMRWIMLCGPSPVDEYLFRYILDELRLKNPNWVCQLQEKICSLIRYMLTFGMPMEVLESRVSYLQEMNEARNAEEALLAVLNACAQISKQISNIDWPSPTAFGSWLSRLQAQRIGYENAFAFKCLSFLNLSNCILIFKDLYAANLQATNLEGANLEGANLSRANLEGSNLSRAILTRANLRRTRLRETNFERAYLEEANLERATFIQANLTRAYLKNANLDWANFESANLSQAQIQNTVFRQVNFNKAVLIGAELINTTFIKVNLVGTILGGANLEKSNFFQEQLVGANFDWANLSEANLSEANLLGADFTDANLYKANLSNAKLVEANLTRANLEEANLEEANLEEVIFKDTNLKNAAINASGNT
ncbi:MAG: pentapeptide repeat-containing protein [Leptolyngbya sp. SIO3F4]|nr:pentapeptide repeat-containing protein [Leptolyngbya sp. SIO3F4]